MEKGRISKYVSEKRKQRGLTQKDLAELLFYTPQALSRFEALDSAFPLSQADALCKALDCSLDDIYLRKLDDTHYEPLPFEVEQLGGLLSDIRKRKQISQDDIASSCNVSTRSLRNYETGKGNISLQFLDAFCSAVGLLPSELSVKEEEPAPVTIQPEPKRRLWIPAVSILSLLGVVVALVLTFILVPKNNQVPLGEQSSTSTISEAQSMTGKYGLPIEIGMPNFLEIQCNRHYFSSIGDTIMLTFADPYDPNPITLNNDQSYIISLSDEYSSGMVIDYTMISQNQVAITLKSARNGQGSFINLFVGSDWYYSLGFFYYRTNDPVYIPSDTGHFYPINGGKVLSDSKGEVDLRVATNQSVAFEGAATNNGSKVNFDGNNKPIYSFAPGGLEVTRIESHDYKCVIEYNHIKVPKEIEIDNVLVLGWLKVADNQGEYWYFLDPLVIRVVK